MKPRIPVVFRLFLFLSVVLLILANSSNPNNGNTGAPGEGTCAGCHTTPPAGVSGVISLSGLPATVMPNTTYTLTLTSTVMTGSPSTAGFQLVSLNTSNQNAGNLQDISADVGTETAGSGREYVEHRGDKTISASVVSWTFEWTAPLTAPGNGNITMYATSILANNNGSSGGDRMIQNSFVTNLQSGGPAVVVTIPTSTNVSCFGGSNGTATAVASGGTPPFNYLWSNGQTNATAINLSAGFYSVTVTDAAAQTGSANVVIGQPPVFVPQIVSQTNVSCFGGANGQLVASASGGTSPYSFLWSNGTVGPLANNLTAGTYTVTITDSHNCQVTASATITQPPPFIVNLVSQTNVSCFGTNSGAATVNPSGGTPPYTFLWSNGAMSPGVQNLFAGPYTVTVTDNNSCTFTLPITITQPPLLTISLLSATDPDCNGAATGTASVQGAGGVPPYTYNWSNGASGSTQTNLTAGTYIVSVSDNNNCETSFTIILNDPPGMSLSAQITDVSCGDNCDGAIDLTVNGGTEPLSYLWSSGQSQEDISDLCLGSYTVAVTDANGCLVQSSFMVGGTEALVLSITNQLNVDCNGNETGAVSVEASGGSPPYSYTWSSGDSGPDLSGLAAGTYGVTVSDSQLCTDFLQINIAEPNVLLANASATSETSNGAEDGTASAAPTGGTSPYTYEWNTGATTAGISNLAPGTYTVTVSDFNACQSIESVNVNPFSCVLGANIQTSNVSCAGGMDGTATVAVSNAIDPIQFNWSSGGNMATEPNLSAGTYSVTIMDATSCSIILNFQINQPPALQLSSGLILDADCNGAATGQAEILVSGGTPDYSILWPDGQTSFTAVDLPAGNYTPTISDANACAQSISVTVNEPAAIDANVSSTDETAYLAGDGTASVSPTGGTAGYSYSWSNGGMTNQITGLTPGVYQVTITDANACQQQAAVEIFAFPCSLSADISGLNPSCFGVADGTATATAIGGDGPFTFLWSNGADTQSICELSGETYTVTITDSNGCPATASITLTAPELLEISILNFTEPSCNGATDGFMELEATGGTGSVNFLWTDAQNNMFSGAIQNMLSAGSYTVQATDANDCMATLLINLEEPEILELALSATDETSNASNDGTATAIVSGGTAPYTYTWSNGGDTETITNLMPGTYFLTVLDANGCLAEDVISVNPFGCSLSVNLIPTNITCNGAADGAITAQVSDQNDPPGIASILWSTGAEDMTSINGLAPGIYTVTVISLTGCSVVESINISQPPVLQAVNLGTVAVDCAGAQTGSISLGASGGTAPFTYTIEGNSITILTGEVLQINNLAAGTYTADLEDANGCSTMISFTIEEPDPLLVQTVEILGVDCPGEMTGSATVEVSGGTPPYFYSWPGGGNGPTESGLSEGTYAVSISDLNGCQFLHEIIVPVLDVTPPEIQTMAIDIFLDENGQATISPQDLDAGTIDNCGIVLLGLDQTEFDCDDLAVPIIPLTFTAQDAAGNSAQATVFVTVFDTISPMLQLQNDTTIFNCDGYFEYPFTASDNCSFGIPVLINGLPSGSNFPIGTTLVTWQVEDVSGNSTSVGFTVTVANLLNPFIPITTNTCPGESNGSATVLVSGGQEPYSYQWDDPMGQTTETAGNLAAGIYSVTINDATGCEAIAGVEVFAFPAIIADPIAVTNETNGDGTGAIDLTISQGDAPFSFEWYLNGELIAATEDLTGLSAGLYQVLITDANGCSLSLDAVLVENITGIEGTQFTNTLKVYPNPATDQVILEFGEAPFGEFELNLYDVAGRNHQAIVEQLGSKKISLNTEQLVPGLYLLKIEVAGKIFVRRIVLND
ncbi:MAG: T9SS type A sorting domain-containing protein [Saprospiraceae bacterium]|nr:T9SS type A sorting domain-containing protein [Saprospiraceae bacterium]